MTRLQLHLPAYGMARTVLRGVAAALEWRTEGRQPGEKRRRWERRWELSQQEEGLGEDDCMYEG